MFLPYLASILAGIFYGVTEAINILGIILLNLF